VRLQTANVLGRRHAAIVFPGTVFPECKCEKQLNQLLRGYRISERWLFANQSPWPMYAFAACKRESAVWVRVTQVGRKCESPEFYRHMSNGIHYMIRPVCAFAGCKRPGQGKFCSDIPGDDIPIVALQNGVCERLNLASERSASFQLSESRLNYMPLSVCAQRRYV
jgi:hypothetical protein